MSSKAENIKPKITHERYISSMRSKVKIIKPKYSDQDVERLYFGPNPGKTAAIKFQWAIQNSMIKLLFITFFLFLILKKTSQLSILGSLIFIIPIAVLIIYIYRKRKAFREIGEPYQSPFNREKYLRLLNLYHEAERIIPCLESHSIKSTIIKDDDSVCIQTQNQLVQKEYRCVFKGCAESIFFSGRPNTIDFSVIDRELNLYEEKFMMENNKSSITSDFKKGDGGQNENVAEEEAKELFEKGHSIEELIELFSDEQEQHDIYISSALVMEDFKNIIKILKNMQATEGKMNE